MKIEMEYEDNIRKDLKDIIDQGIINGLYKASNLVHVSAIKNCPTDAGQLRNSLEMKVDEEKKEGAVYTNLEYGIYVEFGTRRHFPPVDALKDWARRKLGNENLAFAVAKGIAAKGTPAQPFLRTALYDNQDKIVGIFDKETKRKID